MHIDTEEDTGYSQGYRIGLSLDIGITYVRETEKDYKIRLSSLYARH